MICQSISSISVLFQLEETYAYYAGRYRNEHHTEQFIATIPVELRPESLQFTAEDFGTEMTHSLACVAKGGNAGKVDRLVNEMVLAMKTRLALTNSLFQEYDSARFYRK